jgi:nucleotide-binding universal stress UspA family protein
MFKKILIGYDGHEGSRLALERGLHLKVQTLIRFGKPAEVILHTAEEMEVDLIILGPSKYSFLRRRVLGSTADKVVERAHCSVLIIKQ